MGQAGFEPSIPEGSDIVSGLVAWTRFRGGEASSFCQLTDFNPAVSGGAVSRMRS